MSNLLALDQGTTGSTALVLDKSLKVLAKHNVPFKQHFPKPGWVEHEPEDLVGSVMKAAKKSLDDSGLKASDISAIGITNQRETALVWDQKGKALHKAIVWQDRRTADKCHKLAIQKGMPEKIRQQTGLTLDPYFSGTKWGWMLEHGVVKKGQTALAGTVDSWLVYKLTGGATFATDASNASRTLLYNLKTGSFDPELRKLFGVDLRLELPEVRDSASDFGKVASGPLKGIPILSIIGDQQAALYGQGAHKAGEAKCTFGTGSFLLMNTGTDLKESTHGLLSTVAWQTKGKRLFALEGSNFISGAAVQWLKEGAELIQSYGETETLAKAAKDSGGVVFVPALAGLGAPYWNADARGAFLGLTRGTTRAQMVRAVLESLAFQTADVLFAMSKDSGKKLTALKVDGGVTTNKFLMQFLADIVAVPVLVAPMVETTALGAALLARQQMGLPPEPPKAGAKVFTPAMKPALRKEHLDRWKTAIGRVI